MGGEPVSVHVYAPPPMVVRLERFDCPTCERSRFAVVAVYEWYGPDATCLRCGERFNEEGRAARPFLPRWREKSVEAAKAFYRRHRSTSLPQQEPSA